MPFTTLNVLDVGCGAHPKGDVNVDLNMNGYQGSMYVDATEIPNPVKADACHLPFTDRAFNRVVSSHMLEHLDEPSKALREMLRLTRETAVLTVPHRYNHKTCKESYRKGEHKQNFNVQVVKDWIHSLKINKKWLIHISCTFKNVKWWLPIRFPHEVKIWLKRKK